MRGQRLHKKTLVRRGFKIYRTQETAAQLPFLWQRLCHAAAVRHMPDGVPGYGLVRIGVPLSEPPPLAEPEPLVPPPLESGPEP